MGIIGNKRLSDNRGCDVDFSIPAAKAVKKKACEAMNHDIRWTTRFAS
jgi:hypothetical protein